MKNKRKHKRLFSVVAVFVVSVVLLLCSSVSAFALPIVKPVTYNGANWVSVTNVPTLRFYFAGQRFDYEDYNIPVQKQIIGNGKGTPQYAYVRFGSYPDEWLVLKPGESIKFYVRYWANVYLSSSPQTPTYNYQATDVNLVYSEYTGDFIQSAKFTAKADTTYPSSNPNSPLPKVCEFTFTNPSTDDIYIHGLDMGDVDGDNSWPSVSGTLQYDTYAGFFNVNRIYYRLITPQEAANDELINGWTPKPQAPSGQDKVDSTNKLEQQIGSNAQEGIDEADKIFDDFAGTLDLLYPGMVFVTGLFNDILGEVSILRSLLIISLTLGVIAFILNLSGTLAGRLHRGDVDKQREKDRAERQKYREEQRARREKYYKSKRK